MYKQHNLALFIYFYGAKLGKRLNTSESINFIWKDNISIRHAFYITT